MILLGDSKDRLWRWCAAIEDVLAGERIGLHPRKKRLVPVSAGLDVLGYRVYPAATRLRRGSGYRFRRRLRGLVRDHAAGACSAEELRCRVADWLGHARQADTEGLCQALLKGVSLPPGRVSERSPGGSRRVLKQQPTEPSVG